MARWRRRRTLLIEQMMVVLPDVCLVQGLRPLANQGGWMQGQLNDRLRVTQSAPYRLVRFGRVGVLSRLPIVATDRLDLGQGAVAVRINAEVSTGESIDFVSVMLTAEPLQISLRRQQVLALVGWLESGPRERVVGGAWFGEPHDAAVFDFIQHGYMSPHAHLDVYRALQVYLFGARTLPKVDGASLFCEKPDKDNVLPSEFVGLLARFWVGTSSQEMKKNADQDVAV